MNFWVIGAALGGFVLGLVFNRWMLRAAFKVAARRTPPEVEQELSDLAESIPELASFLGKTKTKLTPLTDSPEDGMVEERGWVPVRLAGTEEDAIKVLSHAFPLYDGQHYVVTGRSYQRPDLYLLGAFDYFILDPDGADTFKGRTGQWSEWVTWQKCEREDERAVECWDLEIREADDEPEGEE